MVPLPGGTRSGFCPLLLWNLQPASYPEKEIVFSWWDKTNDSSLFLFCWFWVCFPLGPYRFLRDSTGSSIWKVGKEGGKCSILLLHNKCMTSLDFWSYITIPWYMNNTEYCYQSVLSKEDLVFQAEGPPLAPLILRKLKTFFFACKKKSRNEHSLIPTGLLI